MWFAPILLLAFVQFASAGTSCSNTGRNSRECCAHVDTKIPLTHKRLNFTACIEFAADFATDQGRIALAINGKTKFNKTVSVASLKTNPAEICGGIFGVTVCGILKPQSYTNDSITECPSIAIKIFGKKIWDQDFNCFEIHDTVPPALYREAASQEEKRTVLPNFQQRYAKKRAALKKL